MNRFLSAKSVLAAAVVFGGLAMASAAQARTDVQFSIGFPAPVYVQPQPVYVQPAPVYVQPEPVYVQPAPAYVYPRYGYYEARRWHHRDGRWWGNEDRDGDGVRDRFDRAPYNPYRR